MAAGKVSTGLTHATPGEIKSFRSSAERIADIVTPANAQRAAESLCRGPDRYEEQRIEQTYSECCPACGPGRCRGLKVSRGNFVYNQSRFRSTEIHNFVAIAGIRGRPRTTVARTDHRQVPENDVFSSRI